MSLTRTTLSAAVNADTLNIPVTSSTGATAGKALRIDNEFAVVVEVISSTLVSVRSRGDQGTQARTHGVLAAVVFGTGEAGEWPDHPVAQSGQIPPSFREQETLGASGAVTIPIEDTTFVITKATAAALTIANPPKGANGLRLTFVSATAAAHTLTYTAGFSADTTLSDVGTFAATAGATLTVEAQNELWRVISNVGVTIA